MSYIDELNSARRKYLADAYDVGPNKPLGYITINEIVSCELDHAQLAAELKRKGCEVIYSTQIFRNSTTGFFYVYHIATLTDFLKKNKKTLTQYNWPHTPETFIAKVSSSAAPHSSALQDIIDDVYANSRSKDRGKPAFQRPTHSFSLAEKLVGLEFGVIPLEVGIPSPTIAKIIGINPNDKVHLLSEDDVTAICKNRTMKELIALNRPNMDYHSRYCVNTDIADIEGQTASLRNNYARCHV